MARQDVLPVLAASTDGPETPLAVVPLFSGGASGARYCEVNDPRYGEAYEFPAAFSTDADAHGIDRLDAPVETLDIHAFCDERDADIGDMDVRRAYDRQLRDRIAEHDPDIVMLSGYMYIVTDALLGEWPAINVHPADLRIQEDGERKYTGADAVHDAIVGGEEETRSSVHLVTAGVDAGPLITVSPPLPVDQDAVDQLEGEELRAYVDEHQDEMKDACDGPAFVKALHLLADGAVALADGEVRITGEPGPYVMEEQP